MTRSRPVVVCLLLLGSALLAPGPAAAAGPADGGTGTAFHSGNVLAQQGAANATNATNDTPRHRNPESYSGEGNVEALRQRLASQLAARLQGATVNLSQGQYEAANSSLGAEYRDLLSQYADVTGDTGTDSESARTFESAAETQREYVSAVQRYRSTYDAYREAKAAGNTTRARELARELDRLATRINRSSESLADTYAALENTTGEDVGNETVTETATNITETQREISSTLFVETRLSVAALSERASFLDPVSLEGRITTANGTALANRTVMLAVGARRLPAVTDENGSFETTYRPVLLPTGERTVSVAYEPVAASAYRRSTANVTLAVESVEANLTLEDASESARFGDSVSAEGALGVAGEPVPDVPVRLTLDGTTVGTVRTDANGTFSLDARLPAGVSPGEASLTAELAVSGRAITAANDTAPVRIRATDPSLSLNVARRNGSVNATGRLEANGVPLPNRAVRLSANGTALGTARTDADGTFDASFAVPEGATAVRASFDGEGNVRDAAASAWLPAEQSTSTATLPGGWMWLAASLALLVVGVGLYALRGRDDVPESAPAAGTETESEPASTPAPAELLAERAATYRADGEFDAAVRTAYAAVRAGLEVDARAATHWEFYRAAGLSGSADESLRDLTEAYERAAFAPGGADRGTADDAMDAVSELL